MRWDGMPELQEAPENIRFCPTETCHPGTAGRPAENCDKAYDQQFAKVVPRVVGAGIGDVIEGGEEDIHAGNGLQKGDPHPRIHPAQDRKTPQISSNPKRDSPARCRGACDRLDQIMAAHLLEAAVVEALLSNKYRFNRRLRSAWPRTDGGPASLS